LSSASTDIDKPIGSAAGIGPGLATANGPAPLERLAGDASTPAYAELVERFARHYRLRHLGDICGWDRSAMMPPKGNEARAAALAELDQLLHGLLTDPALAPLLSGAATEPLNHLQRANLSEMRRAWLTSNALPTELVQRRSLATARCEHAWRSQRPANDWAGYAANLRPVLNLVREESRLYGQALGLHPYDALMDLYEPGLTRAAVDRVFDPLRSWLPPLIQQVLARQAEHDAADPLIHPTGPFAVDQQRELSLAVMRILGFNFDAGRLDVSAHPFSGGVAEDVRITTRYRDDDLLPSLMGTIHETGHARYEQNLPRSWLGQPVGQSRSMGIHESQSLSFEMQLGCHPGFVQGLAPLTQRFFGDQPAFAPANLARLLTRVAPGKIRVDADEVTYPAHVLLRYDIERALIAGDAEVDDIPALWDEKMAALLGVDTRGDYRNGPMQDVHWSGGAFGYFPCYTLGAMYAAQWFATLRRECPNLDERIAAGDLQPVFDWLERNVWQQASRWSSAELAVRASGSELDVAHYRAHLERRYLS
jgi:carboxypeptidase Taq